MKGVAMGGAEQWQSCPGEGAGGGTPPAQLGGYGGVP